MQVIVAPERLEKIFFQASRELKRVSYVGTDRSDLVVPTAAFLAFGTRPVSKVWLYKGSQLTESFRTCSRLAFVCPKYLCCSLRSQRGSTTCNEGRNGPSNHGPPHSMIHPTGIEEQPEFSPPGSRSSTISRFEIHAWPPWARKESPSQAWTRMSRSNSSMSQPPLRAATDKLQTPTRNHSKDSNTPHDSFKISTTKNPSLSPIPRSPLGQGTPFAFTNSSIPMDPPPSSLAVRPHDSRSSQLITRQVSGNRPIRRLPIPPVVGQVPENRPIRRLPIPPAVGQVPVYIQKKQETRQRAGAYEILRKKSGGSRESNRSAVSVTQVEVHMETLYHYDPPSTNSTSTADRRNKSVGTINGSC